MVAACRRMQGVFNFFWGGGAETPPLGLGSVAGPLETRLSLRVVTVPNLVAVGQSRRACLGSSYTSKLGPSDPAFQGHSRSPVGCVRTIWEV